MVLKDVSHLLHIDNTTISPEETGKRVGLLAAAPKIFAPEEFNAGVMLLRLSESAINKMMCNLGIIPTFELIPAIQTESCQFLPQSQVIQPKFTHPMREGKEAS